MDAKPLGTKDYSSSTQTFPEQNGQDSPVLTENDHNYHNSLKFPRNPNGCTDQEICQILTKALVFIPGKNKAKACQSSSCIYYRGFSAGSQKCQRQQNSGKKYI